jgi:hypothetical protein
MAGNILNFNTKKLELRLSDSEYYDFYLGKDERCRAQVDGLVADCLAVHYDFDNSNTFGVSAVTQDTIYSLTTWSGATNTGYVLDTIGLTGIDNGFITFNKLSGDTGNTALLSALTGSTLVIPSGDTRLTLNRVTGMTGNYVYPMEYVIDSGNTGNYMNFCGGFYQGYYKIDGTSYEVLPNRTPKAWVAEFWLNKTTSGCTNEVTGTTLNDLYPENKGIFFYIGTRAENKFWNQFEGLNTGTTSGCTSGATEWCTVPKEFDISIIDDVTGFAIPLDPPQIIITEITNQFLIYGRAHSGGTFCGITKYTGLGTKIADCWTGDSIFITATTQVQTDFRNPFLVYNRSRGKTCGPCGTTTSGTPTTTCSYSGDSVDVTELDWAADVVDNALAFMIKDDGSIGYRLLTVTGTCSGDTYVSGCSIEESFSASGMVANDQWTNISIRFVANDTYDECELETKGPRKGKLMFYVNCRLKHVVHDFDEFIARRLNDHWKKQVGVPFNISLGGGSQGLLETMTFDGQDPDDLGMCIQENFAGTFIGGISQFRWHTCDVNWCQLKANCAAECDRYNTCSGCRTNPTNFLIDEFGNYVIQESGFRIII